MTKDTTGDEHARSARRIYDQYSDPLTEEGFLQITARMDEMVEHPGGETCGHCYHQVIMAEVAREMLAAGELHEAPRVWSERQSARWQASKFYQLYQAEVDAGRDPEVAFAALGWEM